MKTLKSIFLKKGFIFFRLLCSWDCPVRGWAPNGNTYLPSYRWAYLCIPDKEIYLVLVGGQLPLYRTDTVGITTIGRRLEGPGEVH